MRTSIVIPAYNAARCLPETLATIVAQTTAPDEVIVVDDGSVDGTADVASAHPVVTRVLTRENGGICPARNDGIEASTGELVFNLDADDLWHPEYLERMIGLMTDHPEASSGFARYRPWVDPIESPAAWESSLDRSVVVHDATSYHHAMMDGLPVLPSFHVARRNALRRIGSRPYVEHHRQGEAAYFCGLLAAIGPVVEHRAALGRYRMHATAVTGDEMDAARRIVPCVADLRRVLAERSDLEVPDRTRRRFDRHVAAWYRRCGRRLGGGGERREGRSLLLRAALLGDRRAWLQLGASWCPGLDRRVWVEAWRPPPARRETGSEAWSVE